MTVAFGLLLAMIGGSLWAILFRVDLTPQVESDFFFSTEDPAFRATEEISKLFPSQPQLIISAMAPDIHADSYVEGIGRLSDELAEVPKVASVRSLTRGPASPAAVPASPIWKRLLLSRNPRTTHVIVFIEDDAGGELITRVEEILARHSRPSFDLEISGVPYVVELIRRHLLRDLKVFSGAAFLVFGLVITVLYRAWRPVAGTLLSCLGACLITLTILHLLETPIGVLTANIATIVFVLTLSHTVFLTANWRRVRPGLDRIKAVVEGVRITFTASFWCMVAALLGFGSLLLASAKPLRELGVSGVVGTTVAILVAYGFYPVFLRAEPSLPAARGKSSGPSKRRVSGAVGPAVIAVLCLLAGFGLPKTNTDPSLFTYFAEGSEIRSGLELIDRSGGSSPLTIAVSDPEGRRMDSPDVQPSLAKLQEDLEAQPSVGGSLSLSVLLAEARRVPLAALLSNEQLVNILDSEHYDHIARSFVSEDRLSALFFLRMQETDRQEPRREIVGRLTELVREAGLEVELVGGLYDLQGKLGALVASSLVRELGGLLLFFIFVAAAVTRSVRITPAMVGCLAAVPVLLLGTVGHLRQPVDVISAPGANVAISLGIDAMIHLMMAVRRRRRAGDGERSAWANACARMQQPIIGAMLILATGFGIFVLSSFPPTQRFGTVVAAGTLVSAVMALVVLPFLATVGSPYSRSASGEEAHRFG
ncbi:MAG: MMPL family transporter [bacterium]|nr:MMPL family transporter [bacterium]